MKRTGYFGVVQVLNILASIVRNKIAAVLLGPAGLGLMSLYNSSVKLVSDTSNLGISTSSVKHVSEHGAGDGKFRVETVRFWSLVTAVLGAVVCCILSPLISLFFFDSAERWCDILWLSPIVAMSAITAGELSVMKGMGCMRQVALQSVINAVCCIVVTLPFFYLWGVEGILPALLTAAAAALVTTLWFSLRAFPYRFESGQREMLRSGYGMVRLGMAFLLAGILGSGVEFAIRAYIARYGTIDDVGMYNAAYVLVVTYASVIFTSMETDFYPRLSAANRDIAESNSIVNRQIETSLLLIAPLLCLFALFAPTIIPLLYSGAFSPMLMMVRFGIIMMLLRAVILPMEYMSLAKGRAKIYLLTEASYDVVAVVAVIAGYNAFSLAGAGIGLLAATVFNTAVDIYVCHRFYEYHPSGTVTKSFVIQAPIIIALITVTSLTDGVWTWIFGALCFTASALHSYIRLERETGILSDIRKRIKSKL